jgi:2-dehydropantoate 2-reductase
LLKADTPVLSIQNGLGGPQTAASILGSERVMVGVVGGFGASMRASAHAHHNGMELVRLGEFGGPITPRLKKVEDAWLSAGFRVKLFDDIDQLVWEKLLCNCAYSGPCGIVECTIGEVMSDPDLADGALDAAAGARIGAVAQELLPDELVDVVEYLDPEPRAAPDVVASAGRPNAIPSRYAMP